MRKALTRFEIFSQRARPVRKPIQPVHWVLFARTVVWVFFIVCVGSWSFRVIIALYLLFWIPDSMRKVLISFEIFSQSDGPVGKRTNRFVGFYLLEQ